ncbi:hypothetical protein VOLCADRAFT_87652 [Volvox carteri f. nagariensis]|uniref:Uncharacterized protein n=1 Tax=Volvox carteri f. nagariensis TaxID=3068 RepID=D8TLW3_VOLCA|nr:uncharacterized protein VOLCADRAFT_87652 [Volvox carteri f. nagariensis]EFJ51402.1 hypothetical protein VOLCADRAFT_87652 [Volvox carteri f. nagariensis]|eukprot:XP_002947354.1 hypothetical protein VOLCADRAFT_87652 [Volvox carteri f. nagariensis]
MCQLSNRCVRHIATRFKATRYLAHRNAATMHCTAIYTHDYRLAWLVHATIHKVRAFEAPDQTGFSTDSLQIAGPSSVCAAAPHSGSLVHRMHDLPCCFASNRS